MKERKVEFAITRVVTEMGDIDQRGITTLAEAYKAGIRELSGYIYPCISTSTFGLSNSLKCKTPAEQLRVLMHEMKRSGAELKTYNTRSFYPSGQPSGQPSRQPTSEPSIPTGQPSRQPTGQPTSQPTSQPSGQPSVWNKGNAPTAKPTPTPSRTPTGQPTRQPSSQPTAQPSVQPSASSKPSHNPSARPTAPTAKPTSPTAHPTVQPTFINGSLTSVPISRIFLIVEDESPNRYFSVENKVNQQYLSELASACWYHGIQLGIYTTPFYWNNIMTLPFDPMNAKQDRFLSNIDRSYLPLWSPRYDNTPGSMRFFVPFGGWTEVYMKQYNGGSSEARRAGENQINLNYVNSTNLHAGASHVIIDPIGYLA